jgi:hypothetical protein
MRGISRSRCDHVRPEGEDLVAGDVGIASVPHDLDLRIPRQRVADGATGQRRIVHDQDTYFWQDGLHVF